MTKYDPLAVAHAVRARRSELQISVEDAAERARIHVTSWRLIEAGTTQPSPLMIRAVSRVLEWDPATIEGLERGDLRVDNRGEVVVDLDRWPAHSGGDLDGDPAAPIRDITDGRPPLDVDGLDAEQLAEVQAFIDDLRRD